MLNETLKKFLNDSSAILLEGGRRSIVLSANSSESIITGGDSTSSPTGGGEEEDDTTASINISENEWNTIRPFIDEEELMGLEPKARLHIVVSALACNLDHQRNGSGNKRLVGEGNYSELECAERGQDKLLRLLDYVLEDEDDFFESRPSQYLYISTHVIINYSLSSYKSMMKYHPPIRRLHSKWRLNAAIMVWIVVSSSSFVMAQEDNRIMHECKGVEIDMVEEHAFHVDSCLGQYNASSIKDIGPSQFACVGKCILEKTGLVDAEGHPHKENIFKFITDILPPEVHDDLQFKYGKCMDEESGARPTGGILCKLFTFDDVLSLGIFGDLGEDYQEHHPQQLYCPRTFDGWSCWNETPAGETAYAPCPWFVTGFEAGRIAHKQCLKDGTWFKHPLTNSTWSNYTTCVDLEALQVYQNVNTVYEVGYLISLCALILSLFIFCRFRSLSCTRVTIHKHLFASFIINNSLWLVWYRTVVSSSITVNELNQLYCAFIHILTHFFMMANYFWMFNEGFYLHTLLVYAFTRAESKLLRWFYVFGWLGPIIPIGMYTAFRGADSDPTERKECWIHDSKWSLLISGPVCICLLVSLAFLINIVRVLVMKLNASRRVTRTVHGRNNSGRLLGPGEHNQRNGGVSRRESCAPGGNDSAGSLRKASRATLILIPLLGLHYFIIPFRPDNESNKWAAVTYEYVAAFTSSLQGLAVSLIFCFCNGEVLAVLRRHICPSYSSPNTNHHNDSYNDYSCGGKLLGNLASRLFRRNRNGNAGRSRGGGQRPSTFSCSPTTTIMNINTNSVPPSPSRRSSTLVPLEPQEQRHENDQATTTTVVMTLDDDDNDGDDDQNNRLISRTASPRRKYGGGGGSGSDRSSSSNLPHPRPDSYGKGESDGDEDDGNDVQLVVIASPSNNRPGGTRNVVIVSGKENSDHHLGVNEAAV